MSVIAATDPSHHCYNVAFSSSQIPKCCDHFHFKPSFVVLFHKRCDRTSNNIYHKHDPFMVYKRIYESFKNISPFSSSFCHFLLWEETLNVLKCPPCSYQCFTLRVLVISKKRISFNFITRSNFLY